MGVLQGSLRDRLGGLLEAFRGPLRVLYGPFDNVGLLGVLLESLGMPLGLSGALRGPLGVI